MAIFSVDQLFIFFHVEDEPKEDARAPLFLRVAKPANEAAPHAAMRRCPARRDSSSVHKYCGESQVRSGAHNLTIAARLTPLGALPDSMMLAPWPGFGFGARKRASLKQVRGFFPSVSTMLSAGQRGAETTVAIILFNFPPARPALNFLPCKCRFRRARHSDRSGKWHL